jgi:hypothetical protein
MDVTRMCVCVWIGLNWHRKDCSRLPVNIIVDRTDLTVGLLMAVSLQQEDRKQIVCIPHPLTLPEQTQAPRLQNDGLSVKLI